MSRKFLLCLVLVSIGFCSYDLGFVMARSNVQTAVPNTQAFAQGEKASSQGNHAEALEAFQRALSSDPGNHRVRYRLGQTLLVLDRPADAFARFHEVLQEQPGNLAARFELAKCQVRLGDSGNAARQLEWIVKSDPNHHAARALLESCQGKDAVTASHPAANHRSVSADAAFIPLRSKDANPGIEVQSPEENLYVWGGGKKAPPQKPRMMPPPARISGGWKVSDFLKATEESLGVTVEYAKFCLEKGDLANARKNLDKAETLAATKEQAERLLEVQLLKTLLSLYQADIRGFGKSLMGIKSLLSAATHESFLDIYNRASAMQAPEDIARLVGGVAMGAEHFAVAARILQEVTTLQPRDSMSLRILGHAQLEARQLDQAEKTFQAVARYAPNDAEAHFNLGRFYLTAKPNIPYAKYYLAKARELSPHDERTKFLVGTLYLLEGNDAEGSLILENLSKDSKDEALREMAGHLLGLRGEVQGDWERLKQRILTDLAVPGSRYVSSETLIRCGKDALQKGALFQALRFFMESRATAEIGRVYLAMASNLAAAGEADAAAIAAGFGLKAIQDELAVHPNSSQAHLYLALYHVERNDFPTARVHVNEALKRSPGTETRVLLEKLRNNLG
jgi:tetratricopeptide (TPR) repeat protein